MVSLLFFYLRLRSFRHPKINRFHDVTMWKICQRNFTWLQIWRAPWIKGKILSIQYIYIWFSHFSLNLLGSFQLAIFDDRRVNHAGYIIHLWTIFSSFLLGIGYCQKTPPLHEITNWVMGKTPIFDAKYFLCDCDVKPNLWCLRFNVLKITTWLDPWIFDSTTKTRRGMAWTSFRGYIQTHASINMGSISSPMFDA
jgi:hypothetical protein